jgi:hypothetical protein
MSKAISGALAVALTLPASAAAQRLGGSGKVSHAGQRLADLIAGWLGPLLLVLVGGVGIAAFLQRNIAIAVSAVVAGLIAGLFIFDPHGAESAFKGIYQAIF